MAINQGRTPDDPRQPHGGEGRVVDPSPSTDPFGTHPGEIRHDETARGAGPGQPHPVEPLRDRTDSTDSGSTPRDDRTARPAAGRSGSSWIWAIGAVIVAAAILAFFLTDVRQGTDVPVTGTIQEPAQGTRPLDPIPDTPVQPIQPQ